MPPTKFWLNQTWCLGDVVWRNSRWPPWLPSWISLQKFFNQIWIFMLLQCLPQSFGSIWHMVKEEMPFEKFQDGCHLGHRLEQKDFSNSIYSCCTDASHQVSVQDSPGIHLGYWNGMILAILKQTPCLPQFWEEMLFKDLQNGCNGSNLIQ